MRYHPSLSRKNVRWPARFSIRYDNINAKEHRNGYGLFNRVNSVRPINSLQKRGVGSRRYEAAAGWRECSINQHVITGITRVWFPSLLRTITPSLQTGTYLIRDKSITQHPIPIKNPSTLHRFLKRFMQRLFLGDGDYFKRSVQNDRRCSPQFYH